MTYVDLVLDTGELVRIECPTRFEDELYETLEQAMRRRESWSPNRFDGCKAQYEGQSLTRVNMGRVVGQL